MDEKTVLEALKETENLLHKFGYSALPLIMIEEYIKNLNKRIKELEDAE